MTLLFQFVYILASFAVAWLGVYLFLLWCESASQRERREEMRRHLIEVQRNVERRAR